MEGRLDVSIDDLAFDESRKDLGGQKLVGVDRHDVLVENDDVGKLAALERPQSVLREGRVGGIDGHACSRSQI